jgi:hypothetical protein
MYEMKKTYHEWDFGQQVNKATMINQRVGPSASQSGVMGAK